MLLFGRVLRAAGLQVHHARLLDAVRALEWVGLRSRADVHAVLRSLLVHRRDDLAVFDEAFDAFFRAHDTGGSNLPLFSLGERARVVARRNAGAPPRVDLDSEVASPADAALAVGAYSPVEVSRSKDFGELTASEFAEARRLLLRMPWEVGRRRTRRWRRSSHGALDLPRTVRRAAARGGLAADLPFRVRAEARRPIVILADVSGSMDRYSRILLYFACGLSRASADVESFLFATRLTRVTSHLSAAGGHHAVTRVVRSLQDWGGGTRIGEALRTFNTTWARRVMRHAPVVLVVSDGWDRGDPDLLDRELARLRRSCSRLVWLNPLLGASGYEPLTRGMQVALRHVDDFLPVHNLTSVERLASHLRGLFSHHGLHRHL